MYMCVDKYTYIYIYIYIPPSLILSLACKVPRAARVWPANGRHCRLLPGLLPRLELLSVPPDQEPGEKINSRGKKS